MKYYSVNEFETNAATIYENVRSDGSVVITSGDKPKFLVLDIGDNDYEKLIEAIRQAKAFANFRSMQRISVENGNSLMTDEEIEAEIQAARRERRNRERGF